MDPGAFLVHGQVTIIFVVSVGLSVCLCRAFLSCLWSDFNQTWTNLCPLEYRGCATSGAWVTPKKLVVLGVLGLKKLSPPAVLIGLSWFLLILWNASIPKFSWAIFCNFHLEPKLWCHKWHKPRSVATSLYVMFNNPSTIHQQKLQCYSLHYYFVRLAVFSAYNTDSLPTVKLVLNSCPQRL